MNSNKLKPINPRALTTQQTDELIQCLLSFVRATKSTLDAPAQYTSDSMRVAEIESILYAIEKTIIEITTGPTEICAVVKELWTLVPDDKVSNELSARVAACLKRLEK